MKPSSSHIQRVYLGLLLLSTLASSLIWGINTLFLLDAGLSNTQAFLANAFFTAGQAVFEIPTGIVADIKGRRLSYLLGTLTLAFSTLLYLAAWSVEASMLAWAVSSVLLGLGFTFFSGATEAWLVDALEFSGHQGALDDVFAKGQIISGVAMLLGSVAGGFLAQLTDLSVPYIVRAVLLVSTFIVAFVFMKDWGFEPEKKIDLNQDVQRLFKTSFELGLQKPAIRWVMLAAPFTAGVGFYAFYALQPYLLELYQDPSAYGIAGLAAAIVAGAQIVGGLLVPHMRKIFKTRTALLLTAVALNVVLLALIGWTSSFWMAIVLMSIWGLVFAAYQPVRQAYLNGLIPSKQRATVLSFDSLMGSTGGIVVQPTLGRAADLGGYSTSFIGGAVFQSVAIPFILLARRKKAESDTI